MDDKKVMKYYYSFYDVSKDLNQKQFYEFNMAIYKVMFYEEHIDNISFKDNILNILWKSIRHSLKASIDGFCSKKKIDYNSFFTPLTKGLDKGLTIPLANNVNDNDNVKDKGKGKSEYHIFLEELRSKVKMRSKITDTLEGKKLFESIVDKKKLIEDYINHQIEKKEYAVRITKFMEDYEGFYNSKTVNANMTSTGWTK